MLGLHESFTWLAQISSSFPTLGALVMAAHTSLHAPSVMARLHGFCDTISTVSPPRPGGYTGVDITAEAFTLKISKSTGKVQEEHDLFVSATSVPAAAADGHGFGGMVPYYRPRDSPLDTAADTGAEKSTQPAGAGPGPGPNAHETIRELSRAAAATSATLSFPAAAAPSLAAVGAMSSSVGGRNLIVFDRADPEFDDDSDPDDDLDL